MRLFHALALPAGTALLLVAPYLLKRRRRAWQVAIVLMLALGAVRPAQGPRLRGDRGHLGTAARAAGRRLARFRVRHDPITLRSAIWRVPLLGCRRRGRASAWASQGHPSCRGLRETVDLLRCAAAAIPSTSATIRWIPLGVHMIEIGRCCDRVRDLPPAGGAAALPGPDARAAAAELVHAHGTRHAVVLQAPRRQAVLLQRGRRAFVGYRIENGVLLLSGDPVGPPNARAGAARASSRRSPTRAGCKLGAVGASERLCPLYERARAAHDLPRRRGDRRAREVLARGPRDPQGPPVGQPPDEGRLRGRAARGRRARPDTLERDRGGARARARGRAGARLLDGDGLDPRRRSAARRSSCSRATTRTRSAASCTSCRCYGRRDRVAVVHAPRPGDAQRAHRVPRRRRRSSCCASAAWTRCR